MVTPAQALPRDQQIETSVVASYPGSGAVSFTLLEYAMELSAHLLLAKYVVRYMYVLLLTNRLLIPFSFISKFLARK